jgi:hypothetical protein
MIFAAGTYPLEREVAEVHSGGVRERRCPEAWQPLPHYVWALENSRRSGSGAYEATEAYGRFSLPERGAKSQNRAAPEQLPAVLV